MTEQEPAHEARLVQVARPTVDIFGGEGSLWATLAKAVRDSAAGVGGTNTGTLIGVRPPLIDKAASRRIRDLNTTHATCLHARRQSSIGMGHRDQTIHDALDPLCRFSWQDTLNAAWDDYCGEGEGFVEVVWDETRSKILGLNQLDGNLVFVVVERENDSEQFHYQVQSLSGTRETVAMAQWGDLLGLRTRYTGGMVRNDEVQLRASGALAPLGGRIVNSEIIHFRQANSRDPYIGFPRWVSATPAIELAQAMTRHEFDFHFNRGVPEVIYEIVGGNISASDWKAIEKIFRGSQGLGNSQKTAAIHLPGSPDSTRTTMHKLEREGQQPSYGDEMQSIAMLIATAHGIPPLLANIILPGKIGAANEGPNALLLYQKMELGQDQKGCSRLLANTLGSGVKLAQPDGTVKTLTREQFLGKKYGGNDQTGQPRPRDFIALDAPGTPQPGAPAPGGPTDESGAPIYHEAGNGFKTVLDGMTLGAQQTLASMKEPLAGSGRNPADGLLGGASDRKPGDPNYTRP